MPDMGFPGEGCLGQLDSQGEGRSVDVGLGLIGSRFPESPGVNEITREGPG